MNIQAYQGLLECPAHRGWIEFQYNSGDKIADLSASIEAKWGVGERPDDRLLYLNSRSWAFFCAQKDGAYLALRNGDPIPTRPPARSEQLARSRRGHTAFMPWQPEIFDVFFLDGRYWKGARGESVEITANFSIDLPFDRQYGLPNKQYDAHLVALVALVGG